MRKEVYSHVYRNGLKVSQASYSKSFCFLLNAESTASRLCSRMGTVRHLYSDYLVANLAELLSPILFILDIAFDAVAILMQTSAVQLPCLERVIPKYLKLLTSSSCTACMWISALLLPLVLTVTLFLSVLVCAAVMLFVNLYVRSCSSLLLPAINSMSANNRLHRNFALEGEICGSSMVCRIMFP